MSHESSVLSEPLVADGAFVRLLPGVAAFVNLSRTLDRPGLLQGFGTHLLVSELSEPFSTAKGANLDHQRGDRAEMRFTGLTYGSSPV